MPSNWNHFCPYCLTSSKQNWKCGNCGQDTLAIPKSARVPKKGANKKKWASLFSAFPGLLQRLPKTKRLVKIGFK